MKKTIFPVLMILVLTVYTPAVNAALAGSTVLSVSLANYDPNPAIAGSTVEVRIGIENIGGTTTSDLMLEVVPSYPFELVSGENAVQDVGIVQGYQADSTANIKIVKYTMQINKDAPAGSYELKVKYYEQGSTDVTTKSLYLDVKSRENAEVIYIDKTTLVPGKQSSLKFTINNVGNAPLRDLTFNWENSDNIILPVGSDNTKYIKYIDIGSSSNLEYQVMADTNANPGLYKLNLYLTYRDTINGTEKKITTFAGVYVGGGTDFDVAYSESTGSETSFSVANIGSNPAYSVSVIIPEQRGWRVSGSNSVIIGNLNKGDYTVASFKLSSAAAMAQNSSDRSSTSQRTVQRSMNSSDAVLNSSDAVLMQIAYTDTLGERKVVEKEVKVGLQSTTTTEGMAMRGTGTMQQGSVFSNYVLYFLGITLLVGGVMAHRKYRSRRLLDPDFKIKDFFRSKKPRI